MSLDFQLFAIPVRVHIWFVAMALLLGFMWGEDGWAYMLIAVAIVFQGILMHELGHALVGRAYGRTPHIELIGMGGVTWWKQGEPLTPKRSVAVSFAGPAVGIALGLPAYAAVTWLSLEPPIVHYTLTIFAFVNLGWGVLNLLPMLPMDGGNITASLLEMVSPGRGRLLACYVSFATIAILLPIAGVAEMTFAMILLFFFGYSTFQIYQVEKHRTTDEKPEGTPLQRAFLALERGDSKQVIALAGELIQQATTTHARDEAFHLLGWGRLLSGDAEEAQSALQSMSGTRDPDPALEGAVLVELGRSAEAIELLERACERGGRVRPKLFATCQGRGGSLDLRTVVSLELCKRARQEST